MIPDSRHAVFGAPILACRMRHYPSPRSIRVRTSRKYCARGIPNAAFPVVLVRGMYSGSLWRECGGAAAAAGLAAGGAGLFDRLNGCGYNASGKWRPRHRDLAQCAATSVSRSIRRGPKEARSERLGSHHSDPSRCDLNSKQQCQEQAHTRGRPPK